MSQFETVPIPIAVNGLNKDLQPTQIPSASPNMINILVERWGVRKRLGYSILGKNLPLAGIGMELIQYIDAVGNTHHIAISTLSVYKYDSSYRQWVNIGPSNQLQDCEDNGDWSNGSDIALSDSTTKYAGTNSLKITASDDITAGAKIADSTELDTTDLSDYGESSLVSFWYYASKANVDITIHVKDGDTDKEITSDILSPAASTWYHVCKEVDLSEIDTATTLEIDTETDLENEDYILVDDIRVISGFTGKSTNRFSFTVATDLSLFTNNGGSALVITNDNDGLFYFEGDDKFVELDITSTFSDFVTAKEVIEFWNHLFLLNYTDSSANIRSIAYSDLGDVNEYTSGTSNSLMLTDSIGKIMRALKLGSEMIIYSSHSITTCRYLGDNPLFVFPTLVFETGLISEGSIWGFVNAHYFLGADRKIYGYAGGQHLISIGDAIEDDLFSNLNSSESEHIVTGIHSSAHRLYFMYPGGSNTYADRAYAFNYKREDKAWEYYEFGHSINSFSLLDNKHNWYADGYELVTLYPYADDCMFYADESFTQSGYPTPTLLTSDGYVMQMNEVNGKDYTKNIKCVYETMDLTVDNEEHNMRIVWVSLNAMSIKAGGAFDIYYSIDGKESSDATKEWILIEKDISLNTNWHQHRIPIDINSRICRFKIEQDSDKDLRIRNMHVNMSIETTR